MQKCPQLQDERGSILAQGSGEIIKFLEDINKDVRRHGTVRLHIQHAYVVLTFSHMTCHIINVTYYTDRCNTISDI